MRIIADENVVLYCLCIQFWLVEGESNGNSYY